MVISEPEVEVLHGIELAKMSPILHHAFLQGDFVALLREWAGDRGKVGPECTVHLRSGRQGKNRLVPDVAFFAREDLERLSDRQLRRTPIPPMIAVEIRSPGDRPRNIATKILMYIEAGSRLVLDVDPERRVIWAHDAVDKREFKDGTKFVHDAAPGLTFDVTALFNNAEPKTFT